MRTVIERGFIRASCQWILNQSRKLFSDSVKLLTTRCKYNPDLEERFREIRKDLKIERILNIQDRFRRVVNHRSNHSPDLTERFRKSMDLKSRERLGKINYAMLKDSVGLNSKSNPKLTTNL